MMKNPLARPVAGQRELPFPTGGWPRGLYLVRLHLPEGHSQVARLVVE